jgi:transposase
MRHGTTTDPFPKQLVLLLDPSRLRGAGAITPRNARRGVAHGSGLSQQRRLVERSLGWLHAFERLRNPYDYGAATSACSN